MDLQALRERETIELAEDEYDPETPREGEGDRAVATVVYDDRGRVLLTCDADWDGWVFPGGMVRYGEDLRTAAARETREETGVDPEIVDAIRVVDQRFVYEPVGEVGSLPFVCFEGFATADPGDPAELGEPGETIHDVDWFETVPEDTPRTDEIARALDRGPSSRADR